MRNHATIFFKIALLFNGFGFLSSPSLHQDYLHLYDSPELTRMLWIIALSFH